MEPSSITTTCIGILAVACPGVMRLVRPTDQPSARTRCMRFAAEPWKSAMRSIANCLFRCHHRHLSRPVTPVRQHGVPQGETYVVCLDCGRQFTYDTLAWHVGGPIANSATRA